MTVGTVAQVGTATLRAVAAALLSSLAACAPPRGGASLSSSAVATPRLMDGCDPSETVMECDGRLASSRSPEAIDSCDPSETVMECDGRLASSRSPEDAVNAASSGGRGTILTCDAASAEVGTLTARRDVKMRMGVCHRRLPTANAVQGDQRSEPRRAGARAFCPVLGRRASSAERRLPRWRPHDGPDRDDEGLLRLLEGDRPERR
jgi:hypothetical protein